MRPFRLFLLVMATISASGCGHSSLQQAMFGSQAAPQSAAAPQMMRADLDSFAYGRSATMAVASVQPQAPSHARYQAQAYAAAPAQANVPVTVDARSPGRPVRYAATSVPAAPPPAVQANAQAVPVAATMPAYALDTGDKLRIVVFGQDGLSNSYFVDAAGQVTMPLIGALNARGLTTQQLSRAVSEKLRAGYIRDPHVAIEVETYRPFFILGEVTQPGQYPYVPNMTIETAVAIAGGFTPRAWRYDVEIDRPATGGTARGRGSVPLLTRVNPGDTIVVKERWY